MNIKSTLILLAVYFISATYSYAVAPTIPICKVQLNTGSNPSVLAIPSPGTIQSNITISGAQPTIWDVDVRTFIQHAFPAQLDVTVQSPSGTIVTLTTGNGDACDNVFNGTLFDDSAEPASAGNRVTDFVCVDNVVKSPLVPEEGLAAFIGENPNGEWTLTVHDRTASVLGTLDSWSLDITSIPFLPASAGFVTQLVTVNTTISDGIGSGLSSANLTLGPVCGIVARLAVNHPNPADLDISLNAPTGQTFTLTTDNGSSFDNVFADTFFSPTADPGSQVPYGLNAATVHIVTDRVYTNNPGPLLLTPEESLGSLYGQNVSGQWSLSFADDTPTNVGTLVAWGVSVDLCPVPLGDSDGDNSDDVCDECDQDSTKDLAGVCGCGVPDTDSDADGTPDCNDPCPSDPAKLVAGVCGCGTADTDLNANGIVDCLFKDELRAKLNSIQTLAKKLKLKDGVFTKSAKAAKKALKPARLELNSYLNLNGTAIILTDPAVNLLQFNTDIQKALAKAAKGKETFKKDRAKAIKSISALLAAL